MPPTAVRELPRIPDSTAARTGSALSRWSILAWRPRRHVAWVRLCGS